MMVLHIFEKDKNRQKRNTFGHERLELLIGLLQEVFLLSISFGIIIDAVNHLVNPVHIQDPQTMVVIGGIGIIVGILGMFMFWGYHHTHDIEEEIHESQIKHSIALPKEEDENDVKENLLVEPPKIVIESEENRVEESPSDVPVKATNELEPVQVSQSYMTALSAFTYENVQIGESRVYATLHALCLHSFVRIFE